MSLPKTIYFFWQLLNDAIPVRKKLERRGVNLDTICPRCGIKEESVCHVFRDCELVQKLWFLSPLGLRCRLSDGCSMGSWVRNCCEEMEEEALAYIVVIAHGVWLARNKLIFEGKEILMEAVISNAMSILHSFQNTFLDDPKTPNTMQRSCCTGPRTWKTPSVGSYKLNTDAAMVGEGVRGLGVVVRDEEGRVMAAACWKRHGLWDVQHAEATALKLGLAFSKDLCFMKIEAESDCLPVIQALHSGIKSNTYFDVVVSDCIAFGSCFISRNFFHVHRSGNKVAHNLAKLAGSCDDLIWIEDGSHDILNLAALAVMSYFNQ